MKFPAKTRKDTWQEKNYIVLTVTRTLIPLKTGQHPIAPSSVILDEGVRWRRTLFGQRMASHVRKLRVQDRERALTVLPVPQANRPRSFAGAIGQGFTLDVSAQRTVVQVGDPILLKITLRGDTGLETASLPPLTAGGGLSPKDFRLPEGDNTGQLQEDAKYFAVTVRVLREGVKEIPPIAYSWFDPQTGSYQTTHSRPIALSVGKAQVVSAGDVVRSKSRPRDPESATQKTEPAPSPGSSSQPADKQPSTMLTGADLAIETNLGILLGGHGSLLNNPWVQGFCYLLGIGLVGLSLWDRRRAGADPILVARRKQKQRWRAHLEQAASVSEVASALRQMAALSPSDLPRQTLDALLETCDNLAFAPGGGREAPLDAALRQTALDLAQRMMEEKP